MGKRYTPGEKRLRGFLSGDPERIARTADRTIGIADMSVHRHVRAHADEVRAALRQVSLPHGLRARIEGYLDGHHVRPPAGSQPVPAAGCGCDRPAGDPSRLRAFTRISADYYAGHADISVRCDGCGAIWDVIEDVGYHVPQWHWQRRS